MAGHRTLRNRLASRVLLFFLFFAGVVLLQWRGNAFQSEFGGTQDEAAHYITGLMVHDYIAAGFPGPPLLYARNYYLHYPKVALGHWPPVFYIVQAAWTLLFTPSRTSVMLLMAAITALLATVLCETLLEEFSLALSAGAAALLISLPVIEEFSHFVMAEMLVALLLLFAVLAYGRYLDTVRWQPAAWFGIWFSLALMTKGTGIQLALVPPLAVLFSRRWNLLSRFSFWLPAILVLGIAGPWYMWVPGAQHESVARFGGVEFFSRRLSSTPATWAGMLGAVPLVAVIFGILLCLRRMTDRSASGKWTASAAVIVAAFIVRLFIGAFEERHLLGNLPELIMFGTVAVAWLLRRYRWPAISGVALAALAAVVAFDIHASPLKRHFGFSEIARDLLSRPQFKNSVFLVCSNAEGEGMLISEVAAHESRPGHIVLRATKMLASINWMGSDYQVLFHNPQDLIQHLEGIPAGIIVVDNEGRRALHGQLLYQGLQSHPERWELLSRVNDIEVYRLIGHEDKPVGKIRIPMRSGLYGSFQN